MTIEKNEVAEAIHALARAIDRLGTGNAGTNMGAIEFLAVKVGESGEAIAAALSGIEGALREIENAIAERPL